MERRSSCATESRIEIGCGTKNRLLWVDEWYRRSTETHRRAKLPGRLLRSAARTRFMEPGSLEASLTGYWTQGQWCSSSVPKMCDNSSWTSEPSWVSVQVDNQPDSCCVSQRGQARCGPKSQLWRILFRQYTVEYSGFHQHKCTDFPCIRRLRMINAICTLGHE